ncbi:mechanosensitive ion channel [Candidatus Methylospira mobilis]|uniref:mechanosensitive ion channel family protein n=1 Tax=Candidatus Methylospira mobilis TaxID=1808979 RepID=UPI0028EBC211|nr:mechanosensitive ion channel domain-containing protein [Candidatus Methylospira mobilis]WNV05980.1 mechanosensitive ion channel [Candidatus Methylospira mobilis]
MKKPGYLSIIRSCLSIFIIAFFALNAYAETSTSFTTLVEWNDAVDKIEKNAAKPDVNSDQLDAMQTQLATLRTQLQETLNSSILDKQALDVVIGAFGPEPATDSPPEAEPIKAKRKQISDDLIETNNKIKGAELVIAHIDHVLVGIVAAKSARFAEKIRVRNENPLSSELWNKAANEFIAGWRLSCTGLQAFLSNLRISHLPVLGYMGVVGALLLVVYMLRLRKRLKAQAELQQEKPTQEQRLRFALYMGLINSLVPSTVIGVVYAVLYHYGIPDNAQDLALAVILSLIMLFLVAAFCTTVLLPFNPHWRLIGATGHGSRSLGIVIIVITSVFALDNIINELQIYFAASEELTVAHKFISSICITATLLISLRQPFWQTTSNSATRPSILKPQTWGTLRAILSILVLAIPLSALAGYVTLSRLLATQIVLTLGLFIGGALIKSIIAEIIRHQFSLTRENGENLRFWITAFANLLLGLIAVFMLLLIWGARKHEISAWLHQTFFSIRIGNLTLSPSNILFAILLFIGLSLTTRLLQRSLDKHIFPHTLLDIGLRNSIRSSVGYIGFVLAAVLAASTIGLNLSNLAMIVGALSVGIGFGLQNIINNFVSGIILLVERPIKVGDWIVVGEHQGHVAKINVRATELTTFERASVFIPNSSLISSAVMNRTHADRDGRIILPVGIAYDADACLVKSLLLNIADKHPAVKYTPAPNVIFRGFGNDALQLELFVYIVDVDKLLSVTSDLCFSINQSLRENRISIPFPQRDVHLNFEDRQLDAILHSVDTLCERNEKSGWRKASIMGRRNRPVRSRDSEN